MKKKPEQPMQDEEESDVDDVGNAEESSDSENELNLAASATESDEDEEEDDDEDDDSGKDGEIEQSETPAAKSRAKIIDEKIHNKYEQLKGTRLYVRFPAKLPLDEEAFELKVKSLHSLIVKASKPRQKHARFCLVEFKSKEDRDTAFNDIKASVESDLACKGIFVSLPKTDSDEFVNELVARKQQSLEKKKTKSLLKRATKKMQRKDKFTTSAIITNLPKTSTLAQVQMFYDNAIDYQLKPGKGKYRDYNVVHLTYPTTFDARNALKQDVTIGGNKIKLRLNTQTKSRPNKANRKRKVTTTDEKNTGEQSGKNKKQKKFISTN